jgi:hypothetical protein
METPAMDPAVKQCFQQYPAAARARLEELRSLIFHCASELGITKIDESLKWGEPSYHAKTGSPIRIDWKAKSPNHYYLFFHCQTKLVVTFRELYGDSLTLEGNRALVLNLNDPLPVEMLKHCMMLALSYHQRKHLPLLGA